MPKTSMFILRDINMSARVTNLRLRFSPRSNVITKAVMKPSLKEKFPQILVRNLAGVIPGDNISPFLNNKHADATLISGNSESWLPYEQKRHSQHDEKSQIIHQHVSSQRALATKCEYQPQPHLLHTGGRKCWSPWFDAFGANPNFISMPSSFTKLSHTRMHCKILVYNSTYVQRKRTTQTMIDMGICMVWVQAGLQGNRRSFSTTTLQTHLHLHVWHTPWNKISWHFTEARIRSPQC